MKIYLNSKVSWKLEDGTVVTGTVAWQKLMLTVVRDDDGSTAYISAKDVTVVPAEGATNA